MTILSTGLPAVLVDSHHALQNITVWQDGDTAPHGLRPIVIGITDPVGIDWIYLSDHTLTDPNPQTVPSAQSQLNLADLQAQLRALQA